MRLHKQSQRLQKQQEPRIAEKVRWWHGILREIEKRYKRGPSAMPNYLHMTWPQPPAVGPLQEPRLRLRPILPTPVVALHPMRRRIHRRRTFRPIRPVRNLREKIECQREVHYQIINLPTCLPSTIPSEIHWRCWRWKGPTPLELQEEIKWRKKTSWKIDLFTDLLSF